MRDLDQVPPSADIAELRVCTGRLPVVGERTVQRWQARAPALSYWSICTELLPSHRASLKAKCSAAQVNPPPAKRAVPWNRALQDAALRRRSRLAALLRAHDGQAAARRHGKELGWTCSWTPPACPTGGPRGSHVDSHGLSQTERDVEGSL